jgi:thymidine phosphorylase
MVALGNECSVNTRAILTDMNTPLGRAAGNWLEVKESVNCLENKGPNGLRELVLVCAAHLLLQTRKAGNFNSAKKIVENCLNSGAPRKKFGEMLLAQGADLHAFNKKLLRNSIAPVVLELKSSQAGFISRSDARIIGEVIRDLGGGRLTKDSKINYDVGIDEIAKPGDQIKKSQILCRVHAVNSAQAETAIDKLKMAFEISAKPKKNYPLISEIITSK